MEEENFSTVPNCTVAHTWVQFPSGWILAKDEVGWIMQRLDKVRVSSAATKFQKLQTLFVNATMSFLYATPTNGCRVFEKTEARRVYLMVDLGLGKGLMGRHESDFETKAKKFLALSISGIRRIIRVRNTLSMKRPNLSQRKIKISKIPLMATHQTFCLNDLSKQIRP